LISIKNNFLFIHIPKTGGNSIQNILKDYSEDEIICKNDLQDGIERFEITNDNYHIFKHARLSHYKTILNSTVYNELYKFAVIRNPWDRMVSLYFSPHRGVHDWSRDDFIDVIKKAPKTYAFVLERNWIEITLSKFGFDANLQKKKINQDIDYFIRFENMDSDFKFVCTKLGIPYVPLPKVNASQRNAYHQYYDAETREMVRKKYIDDIEYFGYKFNENS